MLALTRDCQFAILRGTDMKRSINQPTGIRPDDDKEAITRIGLLLPAELYVMITDGCNLTCRHCWPRARDVAAAVSISPSDLQTLVESFIRLGVDTLILTGGEPLTHPDCMSMLARLAGQTGLDEVCLQTNGTLLTPDCVAQINTLPREKIRIQVSLDGAHPATHDGLRGTDRFRQAVDGVRRLSRMGWGPNIRLAFTETESSMDSLPDLLNLADELGVGQVVSGCLVKKGRAGNDTDLKLPRPDQYQSLLTRYHEDQAFQQQYHRLANFSAIEWFNGRAFPIDNQCQCMRMPYVTAAGDLYPCNMLPEVRWRIADVFNRPFAEVIDALLTGWQDIPEVYRRRREIPTCQSCAGNEHCGGGCPGRAINVESDGNLPEDRCILRKTVYRYSVTIHE
jgi:radical SAM protein with 4Fe4S-binding SPASM domain